METNFDVVVIGGGASGMMSAIFASRKGKKTLILDHNEKQCGNTFGKHYAQQQIYVFCSQRVHSARHYGVF